MRDMQKAIISVVGKDRTGIIAGVCTYLASVNVNIEDISQTIIQGYFTMMMICTMDGATEEFHQISRDLEEVGRQLGVQVKLQREEIFEKMQRI